MLPANTGVWIIKYPSGRYGYVGMVPPCLGTEVPATSDDVRAGRSYQRDGLSFTLKFPSFDTLSEARGFATGYGVPTRTNEPEAS